MNMLHDDIQSKALIYLTGRVHMLFSYHATLLEVADDPAILKNEWEDFRACQVRTVMAAGTIASLIVLRDLDGFFTRRSQNGKRNRSDDMNASDFGYDKNIQLLTPDQRCNINKTIAHSTMSHMDESWKASHLIELLSNAAKESIIFFEWVCATFCKTHFEIYASAIVAATQLKTFLNFYTGEANKIIMTFGRIHQLP